MAKILRKGLLALLLAIALICGVVAGVLYARPVSAAEESVSGLEAEVDSVNPTGYDVEAYANGDKVFVARTGMVYDKTREYTAKNINDLLDTDASSGTITSDMQVTFLMGETEVDVICDAGDYNVVVVDGEDTYNFPVTIERATVDLANLEWYITKIGNSNANFTLRSYDPLYVYTYSAEAGPELAGKKYPSSRHLDDRQVSSLKLDSEYSTISVEYSAARNRAGAITIDIIGEGYKIAYVKGEDGVYTNIGSGVGKYTAEANLTADGNHVFTLGNVNVLFGMTITLDENDNTKANVKKDWYIVELGNWLVSGKNTAQEKEYSVPDHVFGNGGPVLDVPAPEGKFGGSLTMHLEFNGERISPITGFELRDWGKYFSSVMPAGEYVLTVNVSGVNVTERDEDGKGAAIYHNPFTETYRFTVKKAMLPSLVDVNEALKGKTFTLGVGENKLYDDSVKEKVDAYLNSYDVGRHGTVWADLDKYYGGYDIEFNLLRDYSDEYRSTEEVLKSMGTPDTYIVYYRVSAPNYESSIEKLGNETRYSYFFNVVKYGTLEIPSVNSDGLFYTGNSVLPTVKGSNLYEVRWDEEEDYSLGGTHKVYFALSDTDHYRWVNANGEVLTDAEVPVEFEVKQADNKFTVSLNMLGWEYGSFVSTTNNIRVATLFLDSGKEIRFSVTKDGVVLEGKLGDFTLAEDENGELTVAGSEIEALLAGLDSGTYVLTVTVDETKNYGKLYDEREFVVSKARNLWKDGDDELVLPNWIVGKYNAEESPIVILAQYGTVNFKIEDIGGKVFFDSTVDDEGALAGALNGMGIGKYLVKAWVEASGNFDGLAERTFTIQVFEKAGLPWWVTLIIAVGAVCVAAAIVLILWKTGVFQVVTDKILLSLRTRVSVESTIAAVRAAKMMEDGKKSVADAKRRERIEKERERQEAMTPEERAAELEAKAAAAAAKAAAAAAKAQAAAERARAELAKEKSSSADEVATTDDTPTEE